MPTKKFGSYGTATQFAKELATTGVGCSVRPEGAEWIVSFESATPTGSDAARDSTAEASVDLRAQLIGALDEIKQLKAENHRLNTAVNSLELWNNQLLDEKASLRRELDETNSQLCEFIVDELGPSAKAQVEIYERLVKRYDEKLEQLRMQEKVVELRAKRLELLANAYEEKFGPAEIRKVIESVTSTVVCPRCGGDGGVRGGCDPCGGTGWATQTKLKEVEVAVLPPSGASNP